MSIRATVNQVDVHRVRIGDTAIVSLDAHPGLQFSGRVLSNGGFAKSGSGPWRFSPGNTGNHIKHLRAEITKDKMDEWIVPDLSASADILLTRDEGIVIPTKAVRSGNDLYYVYIVHGDEYRRSRVVVKDFSHTEAMIQSSLDPGDEVFLSEPPE